MFEWIWDWWMALLRYLGFKCHYKILLTGLDNSGKSTLLHMLADEPKTQRLENPPGIRATFGEQLIFDEFHIHVYDLGGMPLPGGNFKAQLPTFDAIIFLIDATDKARFAEAKEWMKPILADVRIPEIPILILANKIDRPNAVDEHEIIFQFGLEEMCTGKEASLPERPLEVFMTSIVARQGYGQGFKWLQQRLRE